MVCNICGVQDATIHLTEITNSQMVEIHLCEVCAQEKGTDFKTHFNVSELLGSLADPSAWVSQAEKSAEKCSQCGMTFVELSKKGRLGCSVCYKVFEKVLDPLIRRIQRSTQHVGKTPSRLNQKNRLEVGDLSRLQQKLRQCVQEEKFEEAAGIRDEIKKLETKSRKSKSPPNRKTSK